MRFASLFPSPSFSTNHSAHPIYRITEASYTVFSTSIEAQSRALTQVPLDLDDTSLTPPLFILDHAQVLKEVMSVYQSSVMDDLEERAHRRRQRSEKLGATVEKEGKDQDEDGDDGLNVSVNLPFEKVLDLAIDPVVESVVLRGEEKARVRPRWDGKVYVINCLTYILVRPFYLSTIYGRIRGANGYLQSILEGFSSFTTPKQDGIKKVLNQRVAELIEEHVRVFFLFSSILSSPSIRSDPNTSLQPIHTVHEPSSRSRSPRHLHYHAQPPNYRAPLALPPNLRTLPPARSSRFLSIPRILVEHHIIPTPLISHFRVHILPHAYHRFKLQSQPFYVVPRRQESGTAKHGITCTLHPQERLGQTHPSVRSDLCECEEGGEWIRGGRDACGE